MKRIISLALAAAFVLASFAGASAADIKVSGEWDFAFEWSRNTSFNDDESSPDDAGSDSGFEALQRIRTQVIIAASENVSGTLFFEIGDTTWGSGGSELAFGGRGEGGGAGTDGINIETRRAYIDFAVPDTDLAIRMGLQGLALPSAVGGNPVMDGDVAAVVASYAFNDMFALTGFWARAADEVVVLGGDRNDDGDTHTQFDAAGLVLDTNFDGFSFDPYFMYAWIGDRAAITNSMTSSIAIPGVDGATARDARDNQTAWWAGAAFEMTLFDPFLLAIDAIYSHVDGGDAEVMDASGWFVSAKAEYKLDWFTPGVWGWYGSGNDDDNNRDGSGQLTTVIPSGFAPTSFGFDGAAGILSGGVVSLTGAGTWGAMLVLDDISFIEDVSHVLRVAYYSGTNDEDSQDVYGDAGNAIYMTTEDHAWEVNFDTDYQIYENLAAALQLGWIKMDLDDLDQNSNRDETTDAWRAGVNLTYSF